MSSFDERLEQELAKLEEQKKKKKKNVSLTAGQYSYLPSYQEGDDIAPAVTISDNGDDIAPVSGSRFGGTRRISGEREKAEERTWFQKGAFEDGYQFGDISKAILGTAEDAIQDLGIGAVGIVEKTIDAGAYLVGGAGKLFGADKFSDKVQKFIARDIINEEEFVKNRLGWGDAPMNQLWDLTMGPSEDNSVLGKKSDSLLQSGGQLAGTIGLQAVGVPWYVTSGTTSFGAGAEEAFNEDATYGEAGLSAAVSAGAEVLTEKLFGGSGLGEKGLINLDGLTKGIANKLVKTLVDFGVDMAAEGAEEVVSEFASNLGSALYKEENLGDLLFSEEAVDGYIESFIGGAVLSGGMNAGKAGSAVKSGRDYRTGLSANEEAVFNKEYEDRIAKAEKNGELSQKQKDKIYDEVMHDLENGGISTDTIEEVLGGETYKAYQDSVAAENETLKELAELYKGKDKSAELQAEVETFMQNSESRKLKEKLSEEVSGLVSNERLMESYLERGRRSEAFSTDVTQYEERLRPAIQRAIDSGVLNNTRRTRELVETVARLEADLGTVFNFADNKKIAASPYAVEGKIVDGYVDNDGNITVNVQSPKALNFTVGHEITHVLQDTELGSKLDEVLTEYAKGRKAKDGKFENEYMERLYDVRQRYKSIDGYQGVEGFNKVKKEVSADLVGEYLFNDRDFISQLSVKNRNLFQRLWDEVKYLAKVATAGSKEARELERVKKTFEDAYRKAGEGGTKNNATSGAQYLIREDIVDVNGKEYNSVVELDKTVSKRTMSEPKKFMRYIVNNLVGLEIPVIDGDGNTEVIEFAGEGETVTKTKGRHPVLGELAYAKGDTRKQVIVNAEEVIQESVYDPEYSSTDNEHGWLDRNGWESRKTYVLTKDGMIYEAYLKIAKAEDGRNILYAVNLNINKGIAVDQGATSKKAAVLAAMPSADKVAQESKKVKGYSVSDSDGNAVKENVMVMDGGSVARYSISTWTPETQSKVRENLLKAGYEGDRVDKWIQDTNSIASVIAADKDRLGFVAADNQTMLKNNQEYVKTLDASTLCAKRLTYQGTFDAIQHRMPNTVLSSDDLIELANMMKQHGVETPCAVCYVESRRRHLGKFAQEWLDKYDGAYKPSLDEVTTSDGLEALRKSHPDTYADFTAAMDKKGSANPKVVQLRTEYRNEILSLTPAQIRKIEAIGGLRVQSFSDFETPHLLDMMQAVMDMSAKGLSSQAYTKVPNFAWVFGDTGIKINLSLIAEGDGFDANGNLAFSSVEGMDFNEAMRLREAYSDNVGTIIVGANDKHILACMADDRIDFIIPFHRSGWGRKELELMGMSSYEDYTYGQKEHDLATGKGLANLYPPDYWDYNLSGKENAERYLNLCAITGREPKFSQFLVNNGDGSYSLQPDGSTDGYWKTLIDFKMYNNEGVGAAQQKVQPNFNMEEAYRVLAEYEGGANKLPVAKDVVEEFVAKHQGVQRSISEEGSPEYAPTGSYNIYGNDVYLRQDDDIAPFRPAPETVAENATVEVPEPEVAPVAPVAEAPVDNVDEDVESSEGEVRIDEIVSELNEGKKKVGGYSVYINRDSQSSGATITIKKPDGENIKRRVDGGRYWTNESLRTEAAAMIAEDEGFDVPHYDPDTNIKTVQERLEAKMSNSVTELGAIKQKRSAAYQSLTEKIEKAQAQYDGKKNKDTKVANTLLQRIERLKRLRADVDASYSKRISDIEGRIGKVDAEMQQDHTKADRLERAFARIDRNLSQDKADLEQEFNQRREELADRNAYIADNAMRLYKELRNLKKGVRASEQLGYLLDSGYEWSSIKSALVNISHNPNETVNINSGAEALAREMLGREYDDQVEGLDGEYAKMVAELEAGAKKRREEAIEEERKLTRKDLHQSIVDKVKARFAAGGYDFDSVLKKAKNLSTFSTVDNIPQRVMEKSLGYKEGQILSDMTVDQVARNETEGIKWLNSFTDRKNGVLANLAKKYGIKPGSKESAAAQMYAEGFYVNDANEIIQYGDAELAKDFPDAKVLNNIKGLAKDPVIRQIYDETLAAINESRTRNAYPEIQKLDNYFLHFRAMDDTFSRLGLPFNPNDIKAKDLPTDLNGVTADLKPGQPYFASAMHRTGMRTSFDLLGGLEKYLTSAKNQIYHIDDIQTLRALRNYIADTYGQANGLEGLDALTEEEAQEQIEKVYDSHLSTFAKFLNEEANVIAGKTALIDRGLEGIIGRRGITFLSTVNRQVGANMVGFNVSSSLTNFLAPVQAFAKTNKAAFVKGFAQTVQSKLGSIVGKTDAFVENNPTIIRRKGADSFYRTPFQKVGDAGYLLMSAVDNISTEVIVRAKYNELIKKGMSHDEAIVEADKWTSRLMGDRSLGQQPQLYNSKMLGILTKFQLEVRNQLDSQFYDTIKEAQVSNEDIQNAKARNAKTAAKVASTFFQLALGQHIFGKAFESIAGYNPAFDIISVIATALGWDDEEDSEDTALDNIEQGFMELLEDLPYTSTFTGGRIPIQSALPIEQLIKGEDQYGNEKSRWKTLGEVAPYYVLPGGYGQIKKTVAGLKMFSDDLPVAGSYTNSGNLRFPVEETPLNVAQAAVFGQYASKNAREYFDEDIAPLNPKQIQEYQDLDLPISEYWDIRKGLKGLDKLEEKADYIDSLDLPIGKKNILINNIADRKEPIDMEDYGQYGSMEEFDYAEKNPEKYSFLKENGISYSEYKSFDDDTQNAWDWGYENPDKMSMAKAVAGDVVGYRQYTSALNDIKADKDSDGKTISGSRKEKVIEYLNDLDLDYGQKIILFRSQYSSQEDRDAYNADILEYLNSRDDISYEETVEILKGLDFTVTSGGSVYWD